MAARSTEEDEAAVENKADVVDLMDSPSVYSTDYGATYQGDSLDLLKELPDNSIDLIITSPPFALQNEKEYGNKDQDSYNDWFMKFIPEISRVLQPHGSFVLETGGAFKKGKPERSIYQWKLLTRIVEESTLKFAQDWYWYNPSKLPSPIEWVNVRKLRGVDAVTHIWWFSKELNKDPSYTDDLKDKIETIESIRSEYSGILEGSELIRIAKSILSGSQTIPESDNKSGEQAELNTIHAEQNGGPDGDQQGLEISVDSVKKLLFSVRTQEHHNWENEYEISNKEVKQVLEFCEGKSGNNPYGEEVKEILTNSLPAYWALYIHDLIIRTNKAPSVYAREAIESVENEESIRRPYPKPEVDNQRNKAVLKSYSEDQEELIETGEYNEGKRSSGHDIGNQSFANENKGSIPKNIITASNTASNTHYQRMCRKYGLDRHPARFPEAIPEKFVNLLTPDPPYDEWERGQKDHAGYLERPIVLDIFGGSNWTGKVAEEASRYWLSFEKDRTYAKTSELRFRSEQELEQLFSTDPEMRAMLALDKRPRPILDLEPFRCEHCEEIFKAHPESKAANGCCSPRCLAAQK